MSLWKRGGRYWADFTVDGGRYRKALRTNDRRVARERERALVERASHGRLRPRDLGKKTLTVRRSRNLTSHRVIPLSRPALRALSRMVEHADQLGHKAEDHYLWPTCRWGRLDPTKPLKMWDTAWRSLRDADIGPPVATDAGALLAHPHRRQVAGARGVGRGTVTRRSEWRRQWRLERPNRPLRRRGRGRSHQNAGRGDLPSGHVTVHVTIGVGRFPAVG